MMRHILRRSFSKHDVPPSFTPLLISNKLAEIILDAAVYTQTRSKSATALVWQEWDSYQSLAILRSWKYQLTTLWLFTVSDLKTIVGPKTALGTFFALCVCTFASDRHECVREQRSTTLEILSRLPLVAFWLWINLLPFNISNQRLPESILEDSLNKSWRPLPSGRLSARSATRVMIGAYLCAFFVSTYLGGLESHIAMIVLGAVYNDMGAGDISWVSRNLVNGLGYVAFGSGALDVALGGRLVWTPSITEWFVIIIAVVASTVQTQDLYDQVGDGQRGRVTMPLSLGDGLTRWITAVNMAFWTLACVRYWDLPLRTAGAHTASLVLCLVSATRTVCLRSEADDKLTFKVWNAWMVSIYTLPLIQYYRSR